ncbi:glycosyltransferase family 2 protein [Deltaproteobacteria bacterium TL4]
MEALVSIVIPAYNAAKYLQQTVESVQSQTYPHWEMLIVDDGSTDNSVELLTELAQKDSRLSLICLKSNSASPAVPRNTGLQQTRGDYIAFLDADDLWHPQKLEVQLQLMREHHSDFCSTTLQRFKKTAPVNPLKIENHELPVILIDHRRLLLKNIIPNSSVMFSRRLLPYVVFREDYRWVEDYQCWLNLHQHHLAHSFKIMLPLLYYRVTKQGFSHSKFQMLKANYQMYSRYPVKGAPIGLKKYFYLSSYIYYSLRRVL